MEEEEARVSETGPGAGAPPVPDPAAPVTDASRLVLDADQIARACARMAHQILERHPGAAGLLLMGIHSRGVPLARRLAAERGAVTVGARGSQLEREYGFGVVRQLFETLVADPSRPGELLSGAAASAVTWAANGVDLREPLNPAEPADSQTMTLPSPSVSVTIVLLNDVLMCACPIAMFFRTRRLVRPRVADLRGGATTSPSSRGRPSSPGPCACGRWSSSAARGPGGRGGGEGDAARGDRLKGEAVPVRALL